jgi:hypothetical protein
MAALRLTDGVHVCKTAGTFVILDLTKDRYLALAPPEAEALRAVFASPASHADAPDPLRPLFDRGVLTRSPSHGRPLEVLARPRPALSLLDGLDPAAGRPTVRRLWGVLTAVGAARRRLRRRPIGETVEQVRARRPVAKGEVDRAALSEETAAFHRLRPLHPADRRCLLDSLALLTYLARRGLHPRWTFGVRLDPWKAHCWVEHDGMVLNDTLEEVAQFTPILTV